MVVTILLATDRKNFFQSFERLSRDQAVFLRFCLRDEKKKRLIAGYQTIIYFCPADVSKNILILVAFARGLIKILQLK